MRYWGLIIGAAMLASAATAKAEDALMPGMTYDWTGPYVGVNGGYGRGHTDWQYFTPGGAPLTHADHDIGGGVAGGQVGYNMMFMQNWVAGVEADYDYSSLHGSTFCPATAFTCQSEISNLGTARGRLGYARDSWMLYGTGGLAWGDVQIETTNTVGVPQPASGTPVNGTSDTRLGWTAGAGIEFAIWERLSVKAEYLHVDLGTRTSNVDNPAIQNVHSADRADVVRVGLNWNFGGGVLPPLLAPAAVPAPPPASTKVFLVFFDWDRDNITQQGMAIIEKAAEAYKSGAAVRLMVTGYTDRSGSPGYNQRLSERRASNVAKVLVGMGIAREQMAVSGHGENDNRVPTADGVREPQNRRVEIVFP